MANIRVDLDSSIDDGQEVIFKSPIDCSKVTGLKVYYLKNNTTASKTFQFADAHGNNVGSIDLFAANVLVKVILDTTLNRAYVQNPDTNKYLEDKFKSLGNSLGSHASQHKKGGADAISPADIGAIPLTNLAQDTDLNTIRTPGFYSIAVVDATKANAPIASHSASLLVERQAGWTHQGSKQTFTAYASNRTFVRTSKYNATLNAWEWYDWIELVPSTRKINGKDLSADISLSAGDVKAVPTSEKGQSNGISELDTNKRNAQPPKLHASEHKTGGADPLTAADVGAVSSRLPELRSGTILDYIMSYINQGVYAGYFMAIGNIADLPRPETSWTYNVEFYTGELSQVYITRSVTGEIWHREINIYTPKWAFDWHQIATTDYAINKNGDEVPGVITFKSYIYGKDVTGGERLFNLFQHGSTLRLRNNVTQNSNYRELYMDDTVLKFNSVGGDGPFSHTILHTGNHADYPVTKIGSSTDLDTITTAGFYAVVASSGSTAASHAPIVSNGASLLVEKHAGWSYGGTKQTFTDYASKRTFVRCSWIQDSVWTWTEWVELTSSNAAGLYNIINSGSALSATDIATGDYIPVGDISASTGKKITLANLITAISSSIDTGGVRIVSGSYNGNGASSRTVSCGGRPLMVLVTCDFGGGYTLNSTSYDKVLIFDGDGVDNWVIGTPSNVEVGNVGIADSGFTVGAAGFNVSDKLYYYFAIMQ